MSRIPKDVIALIRTLEEELSRLQSESSFCLTFEGIVHSLKNSILGVSAASEYISMLADGACEIESDNKKDIHEIKKFADGITSTSTQMISMVQKLLNKAGQDNSEEHKVVDINTIIRDELLFLRLYDEVRSGKISINEKLKEQPIEIELIPHHLAQIFTNLIFNAIDAVSETENASITIETFSDNDEIGFIVSDNGPGIASDVIEHIFNPLYSSKVDDENSKGGSGLGLFSCRRLIRKYSGRIEVEPQLNPGCSFKVIFPIS